MGYTTEFRGKFTLDKPATPEQVEYLNRFSCTRRMNRDPKVLYEKYKGKHGLNGEYGIEGEFFALDDGNCGQNERTGVIDYNRPPKTQPGLWCQWILTEDGGELEWNGGEKFYDYVEWLEYLINNFFTKWDIKLNGKVLWRGEGYDDIGAIVVTNNIVKATVFNDILDIISKCY